MGKVKQMEIKNQTYYFYNDIINLKSFESNFLKIHKKNYKGIDIVTILDTLQLKLLKIINSDDDLLLNKPLKFHTVTIIIKSVFEGGTLYPKVFLDNALFEL